MKHLSHLAILSLTAYSLSGCSISSPHVVTVQHGNESTLSCQQIQYEIESAKRYKVAARADDRFMIKHMNPFTTFFSIYNMNKAETEAQKRIELLEQLYTQKHCATPRVAPYLYQQQELTPNYQPFQRNQETF